MLAIVGLSIFTYAEITDAKTALFGPDAKRVSTLIVMDLILLLLLVALISRRAVHLWLARIRGKAGSRLLTKLVLMFSLVAIVPSITVTISSALFLNQGIEAWFNRKVSTAVEESVAVAEAYLAEHKEMIRADALAIANEINSDVLLASPKSKKLEELFSDQVIKRSLADVIILQKGTGRILARSPFSLSVEFERPPPPEAFRVAETGEVAVISNDGDDKVSALVKLSVFPGSFLLVSRFVDPKVIAHTESTRGAAREYQKLKSQIWGVQVKTTAVFAIITLILLLGAVMLAFTFSNSLVSPIASMVAATGRVKKGDYQVRVKEGPDNDEIATLARAFNAMTAELDSQRKVLISANRQLDERRRFSETVISGVSTGIIALDAEKRVVLLNQAAQGILQAEQMEGRHFSEIIPEISTFFEELENRNEKFIQKEISLERKRKVYNLLIRITVQTYNRIEGFVVSFDDITALVSAQRSAAWSDIARKIAHEVKNPLTPINLAAQRLRKKYADEITSDRESFIRYTDTIARYTADVARIIEGFANFARIPSAKLTKTELNELIRNAYYSAKVTYPNIDFELSIPPSDTIIAGDAGQINQVLMNIIKNATEALELKEPSEGRGMISISARQQGNDIALEISDNGPGFPDELMNRLLEPYITTRAKGSGLGLAIVRKIMEDHGGKIELKNLALGACVKLVFPLIQVGRNLELVREA